MKILKSKFCAFKLASYLLIRGILRRLHSGAESQNFWNPVSLRPFLAGGRGLPAAVPWVGRQAAGATQDELLPGEAVRSWLQALRILSRYHQPNWESCPASNRAPVILTDVLGHQHVPDTTRASSACLRWPARDKAQNSLCRDSEKGLENGLSLFL